jgi:predicted metal-dependent hydrolase
VFALKEHWGLIGFSETNLLYSEQANSISSKQGVAYVVAHEIAHFVRPFILIKNGFY